MPEFKEDKSKFTMKGWSAFTKKTDPPKKKNIHSYHVDTPRNWEPAA